LCFSATFPAGYLFVSGEQESPARIYFLKIRSEVIVRMHPMNS